MANEDFLIALLAERLPRRWRYGWPLANNRPLARPVPCRGAFGLWAIPIDVQAQISRQLAPPLA